MAFTGSENDLSARLLEARSALLPDDDTKSLAMERLQQICDADSIAITGWLLANGNAAISGSIQGNANGSVAPGIVVATTGTAVAQAGTTTSPGVATSTVTGTIIDATVSFK